MWISTSDRTLVLPTALGVLLWACAALALTPREEKALQKVRKFAIHQRHGEVHGHNNPHDDDYFAPPSPLEGPCVDHDAGCEDFAAMMGCLDSDIEKVCAKSCTDCVPLCIDTGYGCSIIKGANLCNKFYDPICKKTCGVCTAATGPTTTPKPKTTAAPTTPGPTTPAKATSPATEPAQATTPAKTTTPAKATTPAKVTTPGPTAAPTTAVEETACNTPTSDSANTCDFSTYTALHTSQLLQNASCAITKTTITEVDKERILMLHNFFRAKVANGHETRGVNGGQPPGSNIRELMWSEELALVATAWAKQCPFLKHDTYSNRRTCNYNVVGQNIYYTWTNKDVSVWERAIGRWYNEVKDVSSSLVAFYTENTDTIGHYTQVMWAETTLVGCGAVTYETEFRGFTFKHAKIYVCNYASAGNILGQPIYKEGTAASNCGEGFIPSTCNPGLCTKVEGTTTYPAWYRFVDKVYTDPLGDPTSEEFKNLKALKENKLTLEYTRLLPDHFVKFVIIAFSTPPGVVMESLLIVKESTPFSEVLEATRLLIVPGGLDVAVPADTFKPPVPPSCKFTAAVPALGDACSYSKFGETHTANLGKNCSCEVTRVGVTSASKQEILKIHNDFRSLVAQGKETRGNPAPQPAGANIKQLVWNDQLAEVAQAWANQCPFLRHDTYTNRRTCQYSVVGQNIYYTWSNKPESVWDRGIKRWYNEVANVPKNIVKFYTEHADTIGHYTQMLWAQTTEIGCGAVYYRTNFRGFKFNHAKIYVCNYGPGGNVLGRPIYLQGPAATKCNGAVSTSYPSLCKAMPAGEVQPTSSPVTDGPITAKPITAEPGKCLFTAPTAEYTSGCPYDTKYKTEHSANLIPNCSCEVHLTGLDVPQKNEILKLHNEFRALVASGAETRGNPGPQPAGANINQLIWSDELAEVAQAWANQCPFLQHDTYTNRQTCKYPVVGQNIYYTWSNKPKSVWSRGISRWYNEVKDLSNLMVKFYVETDATVGHYTQMLWAETAQIGCGQVVYETQFRGYNFKQAKIYVCNYAPAGNILGKPIYLQGAAATKCTNQPSTTYPELCHVNTTPPGGSTTVRGWYDFKIKVYKDELGDKTSKAYRDLILLKELKFRDEYKKTMGNNHFVDFKIVAFLRGPVNSVIIVADLTVRNYITMTQIEAATLTLIIPGGLDLTDVKAIFIPPIQPTTENLIQPTTTPTPEKCKFKAGVPEPTDNCEYSKFGSTHSVNLDVNCSCEVHTVGVSQKDKELILERHNFIRAKVAKGLEKRGNPGKQPAGANIKELVWSDELAYAAQAWANQCPFLQHDTYTNRRTCTFPVVGQNIYYTWSNKAASVWTRGLNRWYNEVKDMSNLLVAFYTETKETVGHYSQMLWAETAQIGCGAVHYKTEFRGYNFQEAKIYVCNYGPAGNILGKPIYLAGKAASKCASKSKSYPSLCESTIENPSEVTTKKPDVCEFKATVPELSAGCDYASFGGLHTGNIAQNCTCAVQKAEVPDVEKEEILKIHNDYRSLVARGEETRGSPGSQPPGSNIKELIWNEQLAEIAQRWANQCPFLQHDTYANRRTCNFPVVGQNIYYTWTNSKKSVWARAIGRWYNEVKDVPNTIVPFYAENTKTIGHYTQVIWGETAEIGCGAVVYKTTFRNIDFSQAKIYVCNYGPAGNILGKPIYEAGPAASACATKPSTNYPDLCESTQIIPTPAPVSTPEPSVCKFEADYEKPVRKNCDYGEKYKKTHSINLPKNCSCEVHTAELAPAEIKEILDRHNTLRAKVAQGEEKRGNPAPQFKGADIRELKWSVQLADVAQAWANQCPFLQHDTYANRKTCVFPVVGQNIYYTWSNSSKTAWKRGIERWYNEVKDVPNTIINFYTESKVTIGHYTQLVWAKTTHIGCGAVVYKTKFRGFFFKNAKIYVCNYGPAGNILGLPIYIKGKEASRCPGSKSTDYKGLCA